MDYVPTRKLAGNQLYFLSAVLAHNLYRELEMRRGAIRRCTTPRRSALWIFAESLTIRQRLIQRAGRLTRPQSRLCLTMSGNKVIRDEFLHYLAPLRRVS